jgi:hypothetical protein
LFAGGLQGSWSVYRKPLGAAVLSSPIAQFANPTYPMDWSRDGQTAILAQSGLPAGLLELQMRNGTTTPLVAGVTQGRSSPDGQWLAYTSGKSGAREIYVRSASGEGVQLVSDGGGQNPHWRGDGRELFYANDRSVMAVDVKPEPSLDKPGPSLELGRPHRLFEHATFMNVQPAPTPDGNDFAVSADGHRLLLDVLDEKATQSPITVVVNWMATLKK